MSFNVVIFVALQLAMTAEAGGAYGHTMVWKLPPYDQASPGRNYEPFRSYWASKIARPHLFPVLSNIVHVLSSASQYYYDVWIAWMPETMPVENYLTVPFQSRFAIWWGSYSLLQIMFLLWPLWRTPVSPSWIELYVYEMTGYGESGARIDLRTGRDPRVWLTCYLPDMPNRAFIHNFWKVQLPPLYMGQGYRTNFWAITTSNGRGPPMPSLPMDRHTALQTFRAMCSELYKSAIKVPIEWVIFVLLPLMAAPYEQGPPRNNI